jgi:hypothetical protein
MGPYDTIQDKSVVVCVTMTDLEKMGDQYRSEVGQYFYMVCSSLWEPETFHLFYKKN